MDNELKPRLKSILQSREGRHKAVTRRELRALLNYSNDRKLRLTIAELRKEGIPILFATDKPAGYFIPATWEELQTGLKSYRSYIIDFCIQRAYIKKAGYLRLRPPNQGVLF